MGSSVPPIQMPSTGDAVTAYDRSMFVPYLRLLDADTDGVPWQEAAREVLRLDPVAEPQQAERLHSAHLQRAKWMASHGYRQLIDDWQRTQQPKPS